MGGGMHAHLGIEQEADRARSADCGDCCCTAKKAPRPKVDADPTKAKAKAKARVEKVVPMVVEEAVPPQGDKGTTTPPKW